jgi:hypothetical protein
MILCCMLFVGHLCLATHRAELLGGAAAQPQQPAPSAAPQPASAAPGGGMFDGLSLARAQSSGFGQPAMPAAQQPQAPQQGADSLFSGLAVAGTAPLFGWHNGPHALAASFGQDGPLISRVRNQHLDDMANHAEGGAAAPQQPPQHVRPPADELADLFTSLSPVDAASSTAGVAGSSASSGGSGFGAGAPSAQRHPWPPTPQQQAGLQPQPQPGPAAPLVGLANGGGGGGHAQARSGAAANPGGAVNPGGAGHARSNSGSGAFEDLDLEFRKQRPMGRCCRPLQCPPHR